MRFTHLSSEIHRSRNHRQTELQRWWTDRRHGKESTKSVRAEFATLFQYTGMMLLEEMASIFLTPYFLRLHSITNAIFSRNLDKGNTRFHELPKENVPAAQHVSAYSNNERVLKGYQSIRFHELSKGPVPAGGSSHRSNHHHGQSPPHNTRHIINGSINFSK
ncbi:hypothetical protein VIGAN_07107500 [Vigna angularis var. angularis]|uniref:Autophagy-related protein 9 n=1 Tax=Vigna angularis var. angularis TaxID=157739 RepID=A0A0S3SHQ6_PHAAN|nr:hypothetical protein VIGAN_07107500 [Vigna angularis var. angularis]